MYVLKSFFSRFNTESSKNDQAVQADLKPHLLSQNVTAFPRLNIEKRPQLNCLLDTVWSLFIICLLLLCLCMFRKICIRGAPASFLRSLDILPYLELVI